MRKCRIELDFSLGQIDKSLVENAYMTVNKLLKSYLEGDLPSLMRVVIAEAYLSPELARNIFARISEQWYDPATKIMNDLVAAGIARPHDTARSARFLIGMMKEVFVWPYLFGVTPDVSRESRRRKTREIVELFLNRYGTEEWLKTLPQTHSD